MSPPKESRAVYDKNAYEEQNLKDSHVSEKTEQINYHSNTETNNNICKKENVNESNVSNRIKHKNNFGNIEIITNICEKGNVTGGDISSKPKDENRLGSIKMIKNKVMFLIKPSMIIIFVIQKITNVCEEENVIQSKICSKAKDENRYGSIETITDVCKEQNLKKIDVSEKTKQKTNLGNTESITNVCEEKNVKENNSSGKVADKNNFDDTETIINVCKEQIRKQSNASRRTKDENSSFNTETTTNISEKQFVDISEKKKGNFDADIDGILIELNSAAFSGVVESQTTGNIFSSKEQNNQEKVYDQFEDHNSNIVIEGNSCKNLPSSNLCENSRHSSDSLESKNTKRENVSGSESNYIPESDISSDQSEEEDLSILKLSKVKSKSKELNNSSLNISQPISNNSTVVPNDENLYVQAIESGLKKDYCIYCNTQQTKLSRHLIRKHGDIDDVKNFVCITKGRPERKFLIAEIRKKGQFYYNTNAAVNSGELKVVRRPHANDNKKATDFSACPRCKDRLLVAFMNLLVQFLRNGFSLQCETTI
ncbi:uncharacterized protein DDB_G0287625-like [Prorops nasuta]|uniref:uncharacterized protein DDB_G0287625-like n=1 Tax=Prorops nasuta TaxID=863751 RepID=UPI0034CF267F